ncbi:MAG TPA: sigma 54-interacting transcriptional regulator [Blastocatellia bacterium]|nr:sigma 54-interacting transcriptional regulator [Blastocatellia bacterium]
MNEPKILPVPKLISIAGPVEGTTYSLTGSETRIGREPSNSIRIADPMLSRRHCRINREGNQFVLHDLRSANGTFVNGVPIKVRSLSNRDTIKAGDSMLLFICYEEDESNPSTTTVQLNDDLLTTQSTIVLRQEEGVYLNAPEALPINESTAQNFQALLRIGLEINTIRDLQTLQSRLLELIFSVVPAEHGAILLTESVSGEITSCFGWPHLEQQPQTVTASRTIVQQVLREGVAILRNDVAEEAFLQLSKSLILSGVKSLLAVPLSRSQHTFGVIYLDTTNLVQSFDEEHLQLVTAIANLAAVALENALHLQQLNNETRRLLAELNFDREMIGESLRMQDVRQFIAKVAPTHSTVLIRGESGTGKELIARAIHLNSPRSNKPFVAINCAVLNETLLESELFGHEKGAFTGAISQKKGKLEMAEGGTVFLDEIGEMSPPLQAKLLRVLQEREIERVGGTHTIKLNIRLIAATNKDLEQAIKTGEFRADLYFRLKVFELMTPPLRERREDIPLLASYFASKFGQKCGRHFKGISAAARDCLKKYEWPGNVRELENAIERAVVMGATEFILPEDLPDEVVEAETPSNSTPSPILNDQEIKTLPVIIGSVMKYHEAMKEAKRQLIIKAYDHVNGNHFEAAKLLGLHPNNLHRLIRNLNLKSALKR